MKNSFLIMFGIFAVLTIVYSIAFSIMEHVSFLDSLYWTIISMTTIGYGDITPQTTYGRFLAIAIALTGIGVYSTLASLMISYIVDTNIAKFQGLLSMKKKDHIVIIGWNEASKECLDELRANNIKEDVVIVSESSVYGHDYVMGELDDKEVLNKAGIDKAKYVIISTNDDSKTILITLIVRQLNPRATIIVKCIKDDNFDLLKHSGADFVILSEGFAGRLMASSIFESSVVMFFEDTSTCKYGSDIFEIKWDGGDTKFIDIFVNLKNDKNLTIIGILRDGELITNPKSDFMVKKDDVLVAIGIQNIVNLHEVSLNGS
ncbi:NAD-binding protein [Methanothermococcus sp. Ax23]|uniref:potassium channel family protein n=1 Tax=Methanothermococcus sp. Ax23 TaxID=3156486 RepID=UPI003BA14691